MVLLLVKGEAEDNQFLYECPASSAIDDVSTAVVEIHNLQTKILQLARRLRENFFNGSPPESWTAAAISLYRATSEAATYVSKEQVLHKRCLSPNILRDHLQNIEKELMVSPMMEISGTTVSQLLSDFDLRDGDMTQLWWAGKELLKGKQLCDYVGNNEKTKITIRLLSVTAAPPQNLTSCKFPVSPIRKAIRNPGGLHEASSWLRSERVLTLHRLNYPLEHPPADVPDRSVLWGCAAECEISTSEKLFRTLVNSSFHKIPSAIAVRSIIKERSYAVLRLYILAKIMSFEEMMMSSSSLSSSSSKCYPIICGRLHEFYSIKYFFYQVL